MYVTLLYMNICVPEVGNSGKDNNCISQYLWDVITCLCRGYLFLLRLGTLIPVSSSDISFYLSRFTRRWAWPVRVTGVLRSGLSSGTVRCMSVPCWHSSSSYHSPSWVLLTSASPWRCGGSHQTAWNSGPTGMLNFWEKAVKLMEKMDVLRNKSAIYS